jgi:hypothetical protein
MRLALVLLLPLAACATVRDVDHALTAVARTSDGLTAVEAGIATVATRTGELLSSARDGIAATASTTETTIAAVGSLAGHLSALSVELERTMQAARPGIAASTSALATTLAGASRVEGAVAARVEAPVPRAVLVALWALGGAIAFLFLHSVYAHLTLKKEVRRLHEKKVN